ncbi:MAG: TerB family tellurite resistance protein [Candidatus Sumerlaeaceae bacterium]|nr:TerB family tellurite resistance protein [Candidatus Sumerlaeaceae bacterium]
MLENETRKLMKILHLRPDDIYHVFCLALCLTCVDGQMTDKEGETLTRLGFGLGLGPQDIAALTDNAQEAIRDTSVPDVIAFSLANLKAKLNHDQLRGVKQILRYVAGADRKIHPEEKALLDLINEIWQD